MRNTRTITCAIAAATALAAVLTGCSEKAAEQPATVVVTSTSTPSSASSATSRPSTAKPAEPTPGEATPAGKKITRCATAEDALYQAGTTWYDDGTTGWTQYCADRFGTVGPAVGSACPGALHNTRRTSNDGRAVVCNLHTWELDHGQVGSRGEYPSSQPPAPAPSSSAAPASSSRTASSQPSSAPA